jgi:hypothetical protein
VIQLAWIRDIGDQTLITKTQVAKDSWIHPGGPWTFIMVSLECQRCKAKIIGMMKEIMAGIVL